MDETISKTFPWLESDFSINRSENASGCTNKFLFHPVSNFNTLRHQFESGKTQKTAGRRLSVAIGNTKVTIGITIIQV
jgi:hypothetical protein